MSNTTFWNFSTGVTTNSNEFGVVGTSSYALATVRVFLGGVLQGSTTTDASGNWKYILNAVADGGAYNITADMGSGPLSNTFSYNVGVQITGFTNVPGNTFVIGSFNWTVQSAAVAYNVSLVDTHTLRYEIRTGDRYVGDLEAYGTIDRSEICDTKMFPQSQTLNLIYTFM